MVNVNAWILIRSERIGGNDGFVVLWVFRKFGVERSKIMATFLFQKILLIKFG